VRAKLFGREVCTENAHKQTHVPPKTTTATETIRLTTTTTTGRLKSTNQTEKMKSEGK